MSKLHKEIPIHIPCPACGKTGRVKLKWAEKHKSMKCGACKEKVDLRVNPAKSLIARASEAVKSFEQVMDALHAEARRDAKGFKARKKSAKKAKQGGKKKAKLRKKTAKKRSPRKAPAAPVPLLPEPGIGAEFTV